MEGYISKVDLKKMLGIHEAKLIELVEKEILFFYLPKADGTFQQIPLKVQDRKPVQRIDAADRPYTTKKTFYRRPSKQEIAHMLTRAAYFRRTDVEDAKYEGKLSFPETKVTTLSQAGRLGGSRREKNRAILEAIRHYLINDHKMLDEPADKIMRRFARKFTSNNPYSFDLDGNSCEVYCDGDKIHSSIGSKSKKSLKKITVQRIYLPAVKKDILHKKSNIPA